MAALIPTASVTGSGTMTLAGPSTNSNQTVTIPDATGTMMVSGNMPAFSATMTANQSIASSTFTLIQFNSTSGGLGFDTASYFNTSTYLYNPKVAGYYQVTGALAGPSTVVGQLACYLYKNGTAFAELAGIANVSGGAEACGTCLIYLNGSTDYIQIYAYQTSGSSANIFSGSTIASYFQAVMVRNA